MSDSTLLCSNPRVTVSSLKTLIALEDKEQIAEFIEKRFLERYFDPIDALSPAQKNGFYMMAVCCLTIEALQCFREGLPSSNRKSEAVVKRFLEQTPEFSEFRNHTKDFYFDVRCGILHQAETTHGWRIRRSGPLFDPQTLQINATRFQASLKQALKNYVSDLKSQDFNSDLWVKCKGKLAAIAANCAP